MERRMLSYVPDLVEKVFPDILFQRLRGQHEEISIIDGSHLIPKNAPATGEPLSDERNDRKDEEAEEVLDDSTHTTPEPQPRADKVTRSSELNGSQVPQAAEDDHEIRPGCIPASEARKETPCTDSNSLDNASGVSSSDATEGDVQSLVIEDVFKHLCGPEPLYDVERKKWIDCPENTGGENKGKVAEYLNKILGRVRSFLYGAEEGDDDWIFSTPSLGSSTNAGDEKYSPGLILIRRKFKQTCQVAGWNLDWKRTRAVGALSASNFDECEWLVDGSYSCCREMYRQDAARRFGLMFDLFNSYGMTRMTLYKYSRSGCFASPEFDIHDHPMDFLKVMVGMAFGEDYYLGLDPAFSNEGGKDFITIDGTKYEISRAITTDTSLTSRGTVVLRVMHPETKQTLAIKDQWVCREIGPKEIHILRKIHEKGKRRKVVKLVSSKAVAFKVGDVEVLDSTGTDLEGIDEEDACHIEIRDHYRLVLTPCGQSLWRFESLRELVSVCKDYAEAIYDLHKDGFYHRDIGDLNLIIVSKDDANLLQDDDESLANAEETATNTREDREECQQDTSEAMKDGSETRIGFLIDFDCATTAEELKGERKALRGTLPFMPVEMLEDDGCSGHKYYFDLESLFYVLVSMCLIADGPRTKGYHLGSEYKMKGSTLEDWGFEDSEPHEQKRQKLVRLIAYHKEKSVENDEAFTEKILDHLTPYFNPVKQLLLQLRRILFQPYSNTDDADTPEDLKPISERKDIDRVFERYISCLKEARDELPAEDPWPEDPEDNSEGKPAEVHDLARNIPEDASNNLQPKDAATNKSEPTQDAGPEAGSQLSVRSSREDTATTDKPGFNAIPDSGYNSATAVKRKNSESSLTIRSEKRRRGEDSET